MIAKRVGEESLTRESIAKVVDLVLKTHSPDREGAAKALLDDAYHGIESGLRIESLEGHEVFVRKLEDAKKALEKACAILWPKDERQHRAG